VVLRRKLSLTAPTHACTMAEGRNKMPSNSRWDKEFSYWLIGISKERINKAKW